MTARATQQLNSGFGTFLPRDPLVGVPDDVQAAWVEAGLAAYDPRPGAPPTPASGQHAATPAATPAGDDAAKPSGLAWFATLKARAKALGLPAKGKAPELEAAIAAEEQRLANAEAAAAQGGAETDDQVAGGESPSEDGATDDDDADDADAGPDGEPE